MNVRYQLFTRYEKYHPLLNSKDHFDAKKKQNLCQWLYTVYFDVWVMHLSKTILVFTSNGQRAVGEFNSCSNTENSSNSIMPCHKVNFFFSLTSLLSPIVMKCFKCSIYVWLTEYWPTKAWLKTRKRTTWPPPFR